VDLALSGIGGRRRVHRMVGDFRPLDRHSRAGLRILSDADSRRSAAADVAVGSSRTRVSPRTMVIIALGGLFFALDLALYNTGILRTSAGNATLLGNQTPIFVGLLTWLAFRRRPAASFWLGLGLAIAGSLVIVWADIARHAQFGAGDLMRWARRRASRCI